AATRARPSARACAYGGGAEPARPMARSTGMLPGGGSGAQATAATQPIAIVESDYRAFETRLGEIQAAYSAGDVGKLRGLATAEVAGSFPRQLAGNAQRGVGKKGRE